MKKELKKELKQKLVSFSTVYLGDLKKSRQKKLDKYLEGKMNSVADYYVNLLTKKQLKKNLPKNQAIQNTAGQVLDNVENSNPLQ